MKIGLKVMVRKGQAWTALSYYRSFMLVHPISWRLMTQRLLLHCEPISGASRGCTVSTSAHRTWAKDRTDLGVMVGLWVDIRKIFTTVLGSVAVTLGKSASPVPICADSRHICTLSIANVLYLAKEGFENRGYISLNNLTRPFWRDLFGDQHIDSEDLWTSSNGKGMFDKALQALMDTGDTFMAVSKEYAPDGRMSEQIDRYVLVKSGFGLISRNDGSPVGARDLTWSYASFLEAARARDRAAG
jgi:hypothetical protein